MLLDSQLSELRLLSVSALQLQPLDEAPLPLGFFAITADLVDCFRPFFPKTVGIDRRIVVLKPDLLASFLYGLLQTRALKALQGLLRHPASMRAVLDGGLLPAIMVSAATPVPLLGIHHTDTLQSLLTMLEQMHIEAATAARLAKAYAAASRSGRSTRGKSHAASLSGGSPHPTTPSPTGSARAASASGSGAPGASPGEASQLGRLRQHAEMLQSMGFEPMLCQKAVMKFGDDMAAAVTWLTDDQAQQEQRNADRQLRRSPSWQKAEELASMMGFSAAACKKGLEKCANDLNRAANWLLEHGAEVEEEMDEGDAPEEFSEIVTTLRPQAASSSAEGGEDEGGVDEEEESESAATEPLALRTVSFRPGGSSAFSTVGGPAIPSLGGRRGGSRINERRTGEERDDDGPGGERSGGSKEHDVPAEDEFRSAAPPPPPPLPDESTLDAASREGAAPLSRRLSRANAADGSPLPPLVMEEVLVGRLLRPTPLAANRNAVVSLVVEGADTVGLISRLPETDALEKKTRQLRHCQRAEASLAAHFPELKQLGANSSGLDAVSGAAHTSLAIMLLRQAVVYLLADMHGLQRSHEDEASAFQLDQLGQPRDLLDLLKLAYHSSGGSGGTSLAATASASTSPFAKLWSLMEALVRTDQAEAVQLPSVFQALPRLLRDDALKHLRRELSATATLQSPHPLTVPGGKPLKSTAKLTIAGASQMTLHLDARSHLPGTAQLRFSSDEAGKHAVAPRWQGTAGGWVNRTVLGDTLWVHLDGEVPKKELAKKPWGFSVRVTASGWQPPEVEMGALDAPLAIGWQLLELLCEHRPSELLTNHTYRALIRYVHKEDGPHRALAASLLLRLLKLPATALPADMGLDPRTSWPMEPLLTLTSHVDWHRKEAVERVSGLLTPHAQLCAELVAQAHMRVSKVTGGFRPAWVEALLELSEAASYFTAPTSGGAASPPLPKRWVAQLQASFSCIVQKVLEPIWPLEKYAALLKYAASVAAAKGGAEVGKFKASTLAPSDLPPLKEGASGRLESVGLEELQLRFALLQTYNATLQANMAFVWTGYADRAHTLGAQLCALRELIFADIKAARWLAALDATAEIHEPKWTKEHPPPIAVINRHRAGKERADRRARTKHTIFSQLHAQLQFTSPAQLQRRDRSFKVKFTGEAADDYGGPYREVFTSLCGELQTTTTMPLLLLTPNGQHNLGSNRDKYIMDSAATTPELLKWFEFLGMLFAMALLQKETVLSLNLCSVVWKQLVQSPRDASDLAGFDEMACQSLLKMADCEAEGIDEDLFEDLFFETFSAQLSNGQEVQVCEGGASIDVTFANRKRFTELVMRARLREGRAQTHAILRGIASMLPVRLLPLFTHVELERMTCGAPDIDINNLKKHTRFGVSVDPVNDAHIALLWRVLESFTADQRSKFLTFIWSRNRLPQTDEEWGDQCMKIHTLETATPDLHFPVSHTCFFSMEWPRYSTFAVAREKLLYAVINCTDMDMDATAEGRANAAMSFEDAE